MRYIFVICLGLSMHNNMIDAQENEKKDIICVGEIAIKHNTDIVALWDDLAPCERVCAYYLWRASLPGNVIHADQCHRNNREITQIFEHILAHKELLIGHFSAHAIINIVSFVQDVQTYLTYIWTNHSPYFIREFENNKRTPAKLGLNHLTRESLCEVVAFLALQVNTDLERVIFDETYEPTLTVTGDIAKSAVNFYSADFTQDDFKKLSAQEVANPNSYCYIDKDKKQVCVAKYSAATKYAPELSVSLHWLQHAYEHVQQYPQHFDAHLIKSLDYLIAYVQTGEEELFKQHSIEWTKSSSKLDYNYGFIEYYNDPMNNRGMFQAEVTIKAIDMQNLNTLLPCLEAQLPYDVAFRRESLDAAMPNASINRKIFATGGLGPINFTAAYCLPNYDDLRSKYGSKQIIYAPGESIGELLDADTYHKLFHSPAYVAWAQTHDPEFILDRDLFAVQCILHETLGHGSGRLAHHTFKEGDELTINGTTYNIGDTIPVTGENLCVFLAGYESTMEELRAEILALSASIESYDELADAGMFGEWPSKLSKEKIIELLIYNMARHGFRWLLAQHEDAKEITGDHARADTTILNYLIDHGDISITQDEIEAKGETFTVLDIKVGDITKARAAIKDLACEVQRIKSTGDGQAIKKLIDTYGKPIRNPEHLAVMHCNRKATMGNIKAMASLYPHMHPVIENGTITDITISWPQDIVEQNFYFNKLALSQEIL